MNATEKKWTLRAGDTFKTFGTYGVRTHTVAKITRAGINTTADAVGAYEFFGIGWLRSNFGTGWTK